MPREPVAFKFSYDSVAYSMKKLYLEEGIKFKVTSSGFGPQDRG